MKKYTARQLRILNELNLKAAAKKMGRGEGATRSEEEPSKDEFVNKFDAQLEGLDERVEEPALEDDGDLGLPEEEEDLSLGDEGLGGLGDEDLGDEEDDLDMEGLSMSDEDEMGDDLETNDEDTVKLIQTVIDDLTRKSGELENSALMAKEAGDMETYQDIMDISKRLSDEITDQKDKLISIARRSGEDITSILK